MTATVTTNMTDRPMTFAERKAAIRSTKRHAAIAEVTASGGGGLGSTLIGIAVVATAAATAPVSAPIAAIGGICIGAGGASIAHAIRITK